MNVREKACFCIESLRVVRAVGGIAHSRPSPRDDEVEAEEVIHGRFAKLRRDLSSACCSRLTCLTYPRRLDTFRQIVSECRLERRSAAVRVQRRRASGGTLTPPRVRPPVVL